MKTETKSINGADKIYFTKFTNRDGFKGIIGVETLDCLADFQWFLILNDADFERVRKEDVPELEMEGYTDLGICQPADWKAYV